MPILVTCPTCSTKLNAPDTAAGKKVKCPKCQAICSVPAPALPAAAAPPPPALELTDDAPKPKPKSIPRATPVKAAAKPATLDDEDDRPTARKKPARDDEPAGRKVRPRDDDAADHPRRATSAPNQRPRASGSKKGGIIGGSIGALFLLMMIGGEVYAVNKTKKAEEDFGSRLEELKRQPTPSEPKDDFEKAVEKLKNGAATQDTYHYFVNQPVREDRRVEVAKLIEKGLQSDVYIIAFDAGSALDSWGTKDNVPALIKALSSTPKDWSAARVNMIKALARIKDPSAIQPLAALYIKDADNRWHIAEALVGFGVEAEPAVRNLLKDPDPKVRDGASKMLENIGAKVEEKEPDAKTSPLPKAPPGWKTLRPPQEEFHCFVTGQVQTATIGIPANQKSVIASAKRYRSTDDTMAYNILVIHFVAGTTEADQQKAMDSLVGSSVVMSLKTAKPDIQKKVTWADRDALEHIYTPADVAVVWQTHSARLGYIAAAYAKSGQFDSEKVKVFLDSFAFEMDKE